MKTITYNEVLYRAAEAAGRVRTALPTPEATMLKSIIALELRSIWHYADWNELVPDPLQVTVTTSSTSNPYFSKNEGSTDPAAPEMGDILGIYTDNPRNPTAQWSDLAFDEGDDVVRLRPPEPVQPSWPWWYQLVAGVVPSQVWVEYVLTCPDLSSLTGDDLANYELPLKFGPWLAARAAGHLLAADGAVQLGSMQMDLARNYLQEIETRITRPEWRWKLRVRK